MDGMTGYCGQVDLTSRVGECCRGTVWQVVRRFGHMNHAGSDSQCGTLLPEATQMILPICKTTCEILKRQ
jgi:hypothetical protein